LCMIKKYLYCILPLRHRGGWVTQIERQNYTFLPIIQHVSNKFFYYYPKSRWNR